MIWLLIAGMCLYSLITGGFFGNALVDLQSEDFGFDNKWKVYVITMAICLFWPITMPTLYWFSGNF